MELRTWLASTPSLSSNEVNEIMRDCDSLADLALLNSENVRKYLPGRNDKGIQDFMGELGKIQAHEEYRDSESDRSVNQREPDEMEGGERLNQQGDGDWGNHVSSTEFKKDDLHLERKDGEDNGQVIYDLLFILQRFDPSQLFCTLRR